MWLYQMISQITGLFKILYTLVRVVLRLMLPGAYRKLAAENLLLRQQLILETRRHKRAPNLSTTDRLLLGYLSTKVDPKRLDRLAIVISPSTLHKLHAAMVMRKYRLLFSNKTKNKPGPKGPSQDLINAVVEMKWCNPRYGVNRIAQQINLAFGFTINKDVVRRILEKHYHQNPRNDGPSWLTTLGHAKDSRWSIDFFRCESISLKSHWVMVVMDQLTRRIIGFAVHDGDLDGRVVCSMLINATKEQGWPNRLSSDNDPLFRYHQWKANLRVLGIEEVKSLPYTPISHPFVERLIGTVRRECLDQTFFWGKTDLEKKLHQFQIYFNEHRCHSAKSDRPPVDFRYQKSLNINKYYWKPFCRGLYELPCEDKV
ncbi:MAG: hypothetical protein RL336_1275 [Pseudomonadota bacterium]|jgi:transposase InsO family protein